MLWERLSREEADPALAAAAAALAGDPRRLVAVVADATPTANACSLAATFPVAFARDWLAGSGDNLDELGAVLASAGDGPAAVVLDGADDIDALALLPVLLERSFGRELRVIVPCDRARAGRLAFVAGGYPRASIAVVATTETVVALPEIDAELLPLVLVGRLPCGRLDGAAGFVERGVAAHHAASGDLVCLLGPDARAALVQRAFAAAPDVAATTIRRVLPLATEQRARLLCGVAASGFVPDEDLADDICAFEAGELPKPLEWIRRGTPLPGWALRAIDRRAERLASGFATRAWIAKLEERPPEEALALLERGLAATTEAALAAELALLRSEWTGSADATDEALRCARIAGGSFVRAALACRASLREAAGEPEAALEDQIEVEQSATSDEALQVAAAAALAQARICEALRRPGDAAAAAERAAGHHGAIGDPARAAFAWMRAASLHVAARDGAGGHAAASAACALGERTGDTRLVGYARWFLGALAERNADPATAAEEYARSVDAYSTLGDMPDRLVPSLERARAAAAGRVAQLSVEENVEVQIPVDAALAEPVVSQAGG